MNDLQSTFLILSASFSSTSCCFSSGNFWDNCKNRCFLAWGFVFALLCSFTKKKTGRVWQYFPAFCHATFHDALITCCNVARAGYIAYCITNGIHLILVKATWPRINQWQSLFSWVKVKENNNMICSDILHKYHDWDFEIVITSESSWVHLDPLPSFYCVRTLFKCSLALFAY